MIKIKKKQITQFLKSNNLIGPELRLLRRELNISNISNIDFLD